MTSHELTILSSEFIETFPGYDVSELHMLARWWDCPDIVRERKRHLGDPIEVTNVCCNMMAGIQPGVLAHEFPKEAWTGGFLSRSIFVYEPRVDTTLLWSIPDVPELSAVAPQLQPETHTMLVSDLEAIRMMGGQVEEANSFLLAYYKWKVTDKMEPYPHHPRLSHYSGRREHQLIKLSLIAAASRNSMVLEGQDFERARQWLEETEHNVDEIFIEMSQGEELLIMRDLHNYITVKGKGDWQPESVAWKFLAGRVPSQRITYFIHAAAHAGFFELMSAGENRGYMIRPIPTEG